jgi:pimeloyl-ACP methyl ester carboxylesterase
MPEDVSYAVFIFDFRDYGESEQGMKSPDELIKDAQAAFLTAAGLPRTAAAANPGKLARVVNSLSFERVWGIGSSIGASAVAFACNGLNQLHSQGQSSAQCLGAFSLSPGENYVGSSFTAEVKSLEQAFPDTLTVCFAADGDKTAFEACNTVSDDVDLFALFEGRDEHGNRLLDEEITTSVPQLSDQPMNALEIIQAYLLTMR